MDENRNREVVVSIIRRGGCRSFKVVNESVIEEETEVEKKNEE